MIYNLFQHIVQNIDVSETKNESMLLKSVIFNSVEEDDKEIKIKFNVNAEIEKCNIFEIDEKTMGNSSRDNKPIEKSIFENNVLNFSDIPIEDKLNYINMLNSTEITAIMDRYISTDYGFTVYMPCPFGAIFKEDSFGGAGLTSIINYARFYKANNKDITVFSDLFKMILFNSVLKNINNDKKIKIEYSNIDDIYAKTVVFFIEEGHFLGAYTDNEISNAYYSFLDSKKTKILMNGCQYTDNPTGRTQNFIIPKDKKETNNRIFFQNYENVKKDILKYSYLLRKMPFYDNGICYYFIPYLAKYNARNVNKTAQNYERIYDLSNDFFESIKVKNKNKDFNSLNESIRNIKSSQMACFKRVFSEFNFENCIVAIKTDSGGDHAIHYFNMIFENQKSIKILLKYYIDLNFSKDFYNFIKWFPSENFQIQFKANIISSFFNDQKIDVSNIIKNSVFFLKNAKLDEIKNISITFIKTINYLRRLNFLIDFCKQQNEFNGNLENIIEKMNKEFEEKMNEKYDFIFNYLVANNITTGLSQTECDMIMSYSGDIANQFKEYIDIDSKDINVTLDGLMFGRAINKIVNIMNSKTYELRNTIEVIRIANSYKLKDFMKIVEKDKAKVLNKLATIKNEEGRYGIYAKFSYILAWKIAEKYNNKERNILDKFLSSAQVAFDSNYFNKKNDNNN